MVAVGLDSAADLGISFSLLGGQRRFFDVPRNGSLLFDYFSSLRQKQGRHREAERLRGLQVDHQLELGRLLDRQIDRLLALEDPGRPSV